MDSLTNRMTLGWLNNFFFFLSFFSSKTGGTVLPCSGED